MTDSHSRIGWFSLLRDLFLDAARAKLQNRNGQGLSNSSVRAVPRGTNVTRALNPARLRLEIAGFGNMNSSLVKNDTVTLARALNTLQNSPITSPPARVASARQMTRSIFSLMNRVLPSHSNKWTPPTWTLLAAMRASL